MFVAHEDRSAPSPEFRGSGMSAETYLEHATPTGFTKRAVVHLILQTCHSYGVTFHCTGRKFICYYLHDLEGSLKNFIMPGVLPTPNPSQEGNKTHGGANSSPGRG